MFIGDYHTHTNYSDGKGSVMDNALAARQRGLKEIAVTDHSFHLLRKHLLITGSIVDALDSLQ